ncbi:coiled-coil domain-containing protein 81-like isoform X2 [Centrocercus urophasianus]|uniref:coiled-coil domain-containing protein 81-like isoform X2 n=1 Tax=Centrocercus urophasianus TaxID=9002 RepID=UPI001C650F01|nr:coiled-coil domain-containing protein 81-like isoform X2 [Centrocercus urophasianus]
MSIWDSTSEYMLQQFALKKGVAVDVLGTFYILRKRICEGTRPMIVPRFYLSQRVAQAQGLIYTNSDIPDDLKVVPLDYSQLSLKTSLPEKLVKECVNDIVVLFSWGAGLGEDYDLVFKGIGVLMSRNRILTMRYREEFLLAVDQTGAALKCLLANPQTEVCVLSGREPAAFHVCPGGIRVLPGFKIKLPSEIKARELSPDKEADEKEGARSYQDKYLHQQKTQPPHHQKGDRAIEGNQKHRRTPMDKKSQAPHSPAEAAPFDSAGAAHQSPARRASSQHPTSKEDRVFPRTIWHPGVSQAAPKTPWGRRSS